MTSIFRSLLCLACVGLTAGCASSRYSPGTLPAAMRATSTAQASRIHLPNLAIQGPNSNAISPGDMLDVRVVSGLEDESPKPLVLQVSQRGDIELPLVGPVQIAGLRPSEASQAIAQRARDTGIYRQPNVTLEIRDRATHRVTVLGAVSEPGVHEIPVANCNVLAAVAKAGGLTDEAGTTVELLRRQSPVIVAGSSSGSDGLRGSDSAVELASYQGGPEATGAGGSGAQPLMQRIDLAQATSAPRQADRLGDGDVIMVLPRESRVIHVAGLVNKPNQFELPNDQDVRLLDALAMAGGRSTIVADKVYVIRQSADSQGQPAVIQASIAKAKRDGAENLLLAPGDMVSVESTPSTVFVQAVESFFRISIGVTNAAFRF